MVQRGKLLGLARILGDTRFFSLLLVFQILDLALTQRLEAGQERQLLLFVNFLVKVRENAVLHLCFLLGGESGQERKLLFFVNFLVKLQKHLCLLLSSNVLIGKLKLL